MLNSLRRDSS